MANATTTKLTPTEEKILNVLSDGMPHLPEELFPCLYDWESATKKNLWNHLYLLRRKLRPRGEEVLVQYLKRKLYYRHITLRCNPANFE